MKRERFQGLLRKNWVVSFLTIFLITGSALPLCITGISIEEKTGMTDLIISLDNPTKFDILKPKKYRMVIEIPNCSRNSTIPDEIEGCGVITSVDIFEEGRKLYIGVNLNKGATRFKAYNKKEPPLIILTIYGTRIEKEPEIDNGGSDVYHNPNPDHNLIVDTVVIDPGHGGRFTGARGCSGSLEKHLTLDISKRLKRLLEENLGMNVYMTRETDCHVFLRDRTGLANKTKADLFISVHCNAFKDPQAHGTETFFLSESRTDLERAVALRENQDFIDELKDAPEGMQDFLTTILASLTQNEFLEESSELAELVQTALIKRLGLRDRGVKQAPFYVLVGAYMPAILVEVAFMSNPTEEKLLLDPDFQEKAAYAIYEGVVEFKKRQEKRLGIN